jgi:hypothetical protein
LALDEAVRDGRIKAGHRLLLIGVGGGFTWESSVYLLPSGDQASGTDHEDRHGVPGQGSQSVGMMAGFDAHPAIRETFDEASAVLGQDLWALVAAGRNRSQPDREYPARRC